MYIMENAYNMLGELLVLDAAKFKFTFRENVCVSEAKYLKYFVL